MKKPNSISQLAAIVDKRSSRWRVCAVTHLVGLSLIAFASPANSASFAEPLNFPLQGAVAIERAIVSGSFSGPRLASNGTLPPRLAPNSDPSACRTAPT